MSISFEFYYRIDSPLRLLVLVYILKSNTKIRTTPNNFELFLICRTEPKPFLVFIYVHTTVYSYEGIGLSRGFYHLKTRTKSQEHAHAEPQNKTHTHVRFI